MPKKGVKSPIQVPSAPTQPQARPAVLVYAGTLTAFRVKQFKCLRSLLLFVARNDIPADEFAIITGTVNSVHPAYKDRASQRHIDADSDTITSAYKRTLQEEE